MPQRIFIVGCQRSGTTLFRLILNSHPKIHCFDEWNSYNKLTTRIYDNPKNANILGFKIPNWTEYFAEYPQHIKFQNKDSALFMMRDVRAVVASMLTLPTSENTVWADGIDLALNKFLNDPHKQFKEKYYCELQSFNAKSNPNLRKAALYWKYKTTQYISMIQKGYPVFPVKYDHFLNQPKSYLKIIFDFLNIAWDDNLMHHNMCAHDEVFNGITVGNTDPKRAIDKTSISKWKNILTPEQECAILEVAGELNDFVKN